LTNASSSASSTLDSHSSFHDIVAKVVGSISKKHHSICRKAARNIRHSCKSKKASASRAKSLIRSLAKCSSKHGRKHHLLAKISHKLGKLNEKSFRKHQNKIQKKL